MTLLIKNVRIVGGDKDYGERADIFVHGKMISAIGKFPEKKADVIIDGQGMYCAPGFIDVDTTSDHYLSLFDDRLQGDFLKQGVTTIIGGHCGSSLAPLLYGGLEAIRKWADPDLINVDWHSVEEFFGVLNKRSLGVNFGMFAGHTTIRRAMIGETLRELTVRELAVLQSIVERAIREGAFGFSSGLEDVHTRGVPYKELKMMAEMVHKEGGIYATHLRSNDFEMVKAMEETVRLVRETNIPTLVTHFVPILGREEEYKRALAMLDALPDSVPLYFSAYPFDMEIAPLYKLLPAWMRQHNMAEMVKSLSTDWLKDRILKELPPLADDDLIVAHAHDNPNLMGKSLKDLMALYETKSKHEALFTFMQSTKLRAVVYYRAVNAELAREALTHSRAMLGSHAASFEGKTARMAKSLRRSGMFTAFLEAADNGSLPLAQAIEKITHGPAQFLRIPRRGMIKEGNYADLVLFKDKEFAMKHVVVNGTPVVRDGELVEAYPGKIVHRHK
ncbi:MAG: amidohydrolase family protein [bacterium]|nr:amidohydrolase family protein [bacterium]